MKTITLDYEEFIILEHKARLNDKEIKEKAYKLLNDWKDEFNSNRKRENQGKKNKLKAVNIKLNLLNSIFGYVKLDEVKKIIKEIEESKLDEE